MTEHAIHVRKRNKFWNFKNNVSLSYLYSEFMFYLTYHKGRMKCSQDLTWDILIDYGGFGFKYLYFNHGVLH